MTSSWGELAGDFLKPSALVPILISATSLYFAWRANERAKAQERRREPKFIPYLGDSYFQSRPNGDRVYRFALTIRNPSDSDNAIALVDLNISYALDGRTPITFKQPVSTMTGSDLPNRMILPARLAAHDTIAGLCEFVVAAGTVDFNKVESYQLVLVDSHQATAHVDVLVVMEKSQ